MTRCKNDSIAVYQDDLKSKKRKEKKSYSFGVQSPSACPFVCELIGCQGLWTTDLCSFRLMVRLENDFGSGTPQSEQWHGLSSCVTTSSLTMLSSSASPSAMSPNMHSIYPTEQLRILPRCHSLQ